MYLLFINFGLIDKIKIVLFIFLVVRLNYKLNFVMVIVGIDNFDNILGKMKVKCIFLDNVLNLGVLLY